MRLIMLQSQRVQTTTHRLETRLESAKHCCQNHRYRAVEGCPSRAAARLRGDHSGTDGLPAGSRTGLSASPTTTISPDPPGAITPPQALGWTATGATEWGGGRGVLGSVGRDSTASGGSGGFPAAGGLGRKTGSENRPLGGVPSFGTARVAKSCARYAASQERSG